MEVIEQMYLKGITAPFGWTYGWEALDGLEYSTLPLQATRALALKCAPPLYTVEQLGEEVHHHGLCWGVGE